MRPDRAAHALAARPAAPPVGARRAGPRRRRGPVGRDERQGRHQRRLHPDRRLPAARSSLLTLIQSALEQAQGPPASAGARKARRPRAAGSRISHRAAAGERLRRPRPGRCADCAWSYERAAPRRRHDRPAGAPQRRRRRRPPRRCWRRFERFAADDDARVLVLTGAGDEAFCAGADLKALETLDPDAPGGPARLHPPRPRPSRRSPRSAAGAWPAGSSSRCGATCASPPTTAQLRLPRAPLGRAADRRRHAAAAAHRRPRPRARPDPHRPRSSTPPRRSPSGLVTEVVPAGDHLARALELAEALAAFPQDDDALRPRRPAPRRALADGSTRRRASRSRRALGRAARSPTARRGPAHGRSSRVRP